MASSFVSSFSMTMEEVCLVHAIDRELYTILAIILFRDPVESMKVMAFWLWLEKSGLRNVVRKMLALPFILINELADETVTYLCAIKGTFFSNVSEIHDLPLLQAFIGKGVTLHSLFEHRFVMARGIADVGEDVCVTALSDIMLHAIERNAAYNNLPRAILRQQPMLARRNEVPREERTMFVTFSKGYPVHESEVTEFFTRVYGDCIESMKMQERQPLEQALYATIVFRSAENVEVILGGVKKAKFTINGKHVWVRKFVPRRTKAAASIGQGMFSSISSVDSCACCTTLV